MPEEETGLLLNGSFCCLKYPNLSNGTELSWVGFKYLLLPCTVANEYGKKTI